MNLRKSVASTVILTLLFIGSVSAKVNQNIASPPVEVSEADCQHMQHLVDLGIVQLPTGCRDVRTSKFTRDQMTVLTLQALYRLGMGTPDGRVESEYLQAGREDILYLKAAFHKELENKGMLEDYRFLTDLSPSSEASDEKRMKNESLKSAVKSGTMM